MLSRRDIKILMILLKTNSIDEYNSITLEDIMKYYNSDSKNVICSQTVRRCALNLINFELVGYGYKKCRTKTYFITIKGIELLSNIKANREGN